jgi:hypothetical protein
VVLRPARNTSGVFLSLCCSRLRLRARREVHRVDNYARRSSASTWCGTGRLSLHVKAGIDAGQGRIRAISNNPHRVMQRTLRE